MANKIILKKSSVTSKAPVAGDLEYGELALNYADGKLYYKTSSNSIGAFNVGPASGTVTSVAATSTDISISGGPITSSGTLTLSLNTVPISKGGTGQTTQQAALNALAGATTAARVLRGNGTNIVLAQVDLTTDVTSTLPVANGGTGVTTSTGTGSVVLSNSPTLVTPRLGTPTSVTLTNATGLPLTTGVTGTLPVANGGTGATTSTGSGSVVLSNSPTLVTPNLGTPSAAVLTNATGLPLTSGVTGTLPIANGGTGQSSFTAGYIRSNGTALSSTSTISGTDVTGNISGTAAGLSITLPISSGGTGQTTQQAALNALAGATTAARVLRGNGTNIVLAQVDLTTDVTGTLPVANGGTGVTTSTGSGANVLSNSPTLVTPILGTPTSVTLTNATGLPLTSGVTGTLPVANGGTGATTSTGTGSVVLSNSPTLVTPNLGTPSAAVLTNATGLPLTSGVTGTLPIANGGTGQTTQQAALNALAGATTAARVLRGNGTNVVLAQVDLTTDVTGTLPVSSGGTGVTTSTGSGSVVLSNSPTLVTPILGTPTSVTLTNATGLPLTTGVTGTLPVANGGTGVTTSTGSGSVVLSNSPTLVNPILGTPASVTLTNATGLPLTTGVTGTLPVGNGGTGITGGTSGGVLYFSGASTIASSGVLAANSLVIGGGSGAAPTTATTAAGILTFLGNPTSSNLAAAVTDETGTGSLVFSISPSLTTPALSGETFSTTANVTAGTNAQGQGALTSDYSIITTATNNPSGVTLPTATVGRRIIVVNRAENGVNVYPEFGGTIDSLAANAAIYLPPTGVFIFNAASTTQWYSSYNLTLGAGATTYPSAGIAYSNGNSWGTSYSTTGSGTVVALANSPTLITPNLGTPSAAVLTNASGLPLTSGVTGILPIANGGTGQSTAQAALNALAGGTTANRVLRGNGTNIVLGQVDLTTDLTGTLAATSGGTGLTSYSTGSILFANSTSSLTTLAATATGFVLASAGTAAGPAYSKVGLTTHITGTLAVANGGTGATTSTGSGSVVLATSPTLVTPNLGTPSAAVLTNASGLPLTSGVTGTLPIANGGTGQTTQQAALNALAGGTTAARVLRGNGTNVVLAQVDLTTDVTGTLPISSGGTGQTSFTAGYIRSNGTALSSTATIPAPDVVGVATLTGLTVSGVTNLTNTTTASSTTTGALVVSGGVGVAGNLYVGGEIVAQKLTIQMTTVTTTTIETDDIIKTLNTTQASSTTTGALQVSGGVGIGRDLYVGGIINGNLSNATNLPLTTGVTGILPIANGGTGQSTAQAALNALAGATTANRVLRANGTNITLAQVDLVTDITGTIQVINGGTGIYSYTPGDLLVANTATSLTTVAGTGTGFVLVSGGVATSPYYGKVGLTTHITGTLAVANGGTGVTTSTGDGSVVLSNSPSLVTPILGTPTSVTLTNATGLPLTSGVTGVLPVANGGTGVTTSTGTGNVVLSNSPSLVTPNLGTPSAAVLTNATGLPLTTGVTGILPIANGGTGQSTAQAALNALAGATTANRVLRANGTNITLAQVDLVTDVTNTIQVVNGGTGIFSYTPGDLLVASTATSLTTLSDTDTGFVLVSGGVSANPYYGKVGLTTHITGTLAVSNGGTGVTSSTGGGSVVLSNNPTLVSPALGTPTSVVLTNATGLPLTTGVTGILPVANGGTGQSTLQAAMNSLAGGTTAARVLRGNGTNVVLAQVDLTTDVTGTLPVTSGGTGVTTSTGTGNVVLSNSPSLVTPNLGTPSAAVLTNATGLPLTTGVTGILPVANGGTGQSTLQAAMNSLAGGTTAARVLRGNGTNVVLAQVDLTTDVTGTLPVTSGGTGVTTSTGTGNVVLSNSPSLVTPNLGTPSAAVLTNATGLPLTSGVTGILPVANGGTGQSTLQAAMNSLAGGTTAARVLRGNGTNVVLAQVDLTTDVTGTLPVSSGGTGVTTSTGTGNVVLSNSPTLVTPNLGTPSVAVLTNATGLPLTTGVTGILPIANGGTGQSTAQAALNALAGATTANRVLRGNGTNITLAQVDLVTDVTGTIQVINGGTGIFSYNPGDLLVANTATSLTTVADTATGFVLTSGGVDANPYYGKVGLTTHITGTLEVANGGTGVTTSTGTGSVVLSNSPSLVTPNLGTPSAAVLTNATGLPLTSGVTGILPIANGGTGQSTAQAALNALAGATTANRVLRANGTNVVLAQVDLTTDVTGTLPVSSGGTGVTTSTGTGSVVLSNSPTLVTPNLGTPSAAVLTNASGLPLTTGVTGILPVANGGTGQSTLQAAMNSLAGGTTAARVLRGNGTNVVLAQVDLTTDVTGTLPVSSGGTGVTTSTGTGNVVLSNSPSLVTPNLGTPSAAVLTNATGLPLTSGVTGILPIANGGTGQSTAQAALNALAGATTANRVLRGNGTNITLAQVDLVTDITGTIQVINGGTGIFSYTPGDLIVANTATSLTTLSDTDTGFVLTSGGVGANPFYGKVGLTTHITGTLAVANGGTGVTTSTGTGNVVLSNSPTLVTPNLGTPSAAVLTNATGLPLTSGVTGTLPIANGGTGQTSFAAGYIRSNGSALSSTATLAAADIVGSASLTGLTVSGATTITSVTSTTSTTTGALVVSGGVGIGQDLRVSGTVYATEFNGVASTATRALTVDTVQRTTTATHYITFVDANNTSAAPESVYTSNALTFNPGTNVLTIAEYSVTQGTNSSAALITTTTATNQVVDSVSSSIYRTIKYLLQVSSGASYQTSEILIIHDGTNAYLTEYGVVKTTTATLASFDATLSGGNMQLLVSPTNAVTTIRAIRTAINI